MGEGPYGANMTLNALLIMGMPTRDDWLVVAWHGKGQFRRTGHSLAIITSGWQVGTRRMGKTNAAPSLRSGVPSRGIDTMGRCRVR